MGVKRVTQMKHTVDIDKVIEHPSGHEDVQSALLKDHPRHVINVVEIIANEKVVSVMERMEMCACNQCISDVLAIALNALPTMYVTSDAGKQYIQLNAYKKQFETDVSFALMKACMVVKDSPKHEEKQL